MIDKMDVMKALDICTEHETDCRKCPYAGIDGCRPVMLRDVQALINGDGPKGAKPITYFHGVGYPFSHRCGRCFHSIEGGQNYCGGCGCRILWG